MNKVIDTVTNRVAGKAIAKVINEVLDEEVIGLIIANKVIIIKNEEELEISKRILEISLGFTKKKALELKKLIF